MTPKREAAPPNLRSLEKRIDNLAKRLGRPIRRIQRAVANTAVGQMLPPSVVKGGTAMKLRVGEAGSRFTPDFDASRSASITLGDYLTQLGDKLAEGWAGFTGTVVELDAPEPEGVPEDYVMLPFRHPTRIPESALVDGATVKRRERSRNAMPMTRLSVMKHLNLLEEAAWWSPRSPVDQRPSVQGRCFGRGGSGAAVPSMTA